METALGYLRESPLAWFAATCTLALLFLPTLRRRPPARRRHLLRSTAAAAGVLTLLIFVALALASLRSFMLDSDEANILSIAAASLHGQPVYHPPFSTDLSYSLLYGPLTSLLYRTVLVIGGGSFLALRILLVAANLLLCWVLYSILRKLVARHTALALLAFPLCILMHWVKACFGVRPDVWILLLLSLAMRSTLIDQQLTAAIFTGLCAGLALGFKLTAAPVVVVLLFTLYRQKGIRTAAICAAITVATALAPFALPNISLPNYLVWLRLASGESIPVEPLLISIFYAAFLAAPVMLLCWAGVKPWHNRPLRSALPELALLALSLVLAATVAAKPGGGPWHLWHTLPILIGYIALSLHNARPCGNTRVDFAICLVAVASTAFALSHAPRDIRALRPPTQQAAQRLQNAREELDTSLTRYKGRVLQMGYGNAPNEDVELLRYILPLRGQPYTLDGSGRIEGMIPPFPTGIITGMKTCINDVWLIPHGERPFSHPSFPPALRDTFQQHYTVDHQGSIYDAWLCKPFIAR